MKQLNLRVKSYILLSVIFIACSAFREANAAASYTSGDGLKNKKPHTEIASKEELRTDIVNYSTKYLGRNYHSGGKTPSGFDCSGFTGFVLGNFDINVSSSSSSQIFDGKYKPLSQVEPGDLIFFARTPKGRIFHVAMVKENTSEGIIVIHSTCSNGVIETNISKDEYWAPKIVEARDVINE